MTNADLACAYVCFCCYLLWNINTVNVFDHSKVTPPITYNILKMRSSTFKWASEQGNIVTVYRGLAEDADIVNDRWDGLTSLLAAVKSDQTCIVRILLATDEVDIEATNENYYAIEKLIN